MVGVNGPPGRHADSDDAKQRCQDLVAYLDEVRLSALDTDPADEEKNPCSAPEGQEEGIQGDEEADRFAHVSPESPHSASELCSS